MNPAKALKQLEKIVVDNSPLILTAAGVVGSVTTAVMTGKATFKAAKIIADRELVVKTHPSTAFGEELERNEKIALVWKVYIPPVLAGVTTLAAIVGANQISTRRAAALAAAYSLSEGRFADYRDKALEKLGVKKEEEVRTAAAQERVNNTPPSTIVIASGKVLFKDEPSGRYFESTMQDIKTAENEINRKIMNDEYAVLTDFYDHVGLSPTSISEEFGWTIVDDKVDILFNTVVTPDGRPCITIDYNVKPVRNGYSKR